MCCLEVLPLRPFTVVLFTVESVRSLILGLSLGKEGKKRKEKIDVVVELKREQRTKDDKTLTALQSKVTMVKLPSS